MNPPVHEIRLGLLKVSIWKTETRQGERYNVTLCRLFKDGAIWRSSAKLQPADLLCGSKLLDLAHTWIYSQLQTRPYSAHDDDESKHSGKEP